MPNWCENILIVEGKENDVKTFVKKSKGKPANFPPALYEFFIREGEKLRPMTEQEKQEYIKKQQEEYKKLEPRFCFNALHPVPDEILKIGYDGAEYYKSKGEEPWGKIDGYHWCIDNWGTKWDIYYDNIEPDIQVFEGKTAEARYYFNTAWTPCQQWLEHIAPMFPQLKFELYYFEPGVMFAGKTVVEKGRFIDDKSEYYEYEDDHSGYLQFVRTYFEEDYLIDEENEK